MADINKFIPFILKWAAGVTPKPGEKVEALFERAKKTGWSDHPLDTGGATQCDVTLATYTAYCKRKKKATPTKETLHNIPFAEWREILKESYWNVWKADQIRNQSLAEILVDWVWASGSKTIKNAQKVLGVTADGIVGVKTLAALNNCSDPHGLFVKLRTARITFVNDIVKARPSQNIWLKGWLNRINSIQFTA